MERVSDHLFRTEPEFPFGGSSVQTHAYVLLRPDSNVVLYSSRHLPAEEDWLRAAGGVARQFLNHRDEAGPACDWLYETFGAPLTCHDLEREAISRQCAVHDTVAGEGEVLPDLLAVPTPGHCPGSTCYLWQGPDRRYLFTGDTIYLNEGRWEVYVSRGTAAEMTASLDRIAALPFDCLVPGLFIGAIKTADTTPTDTRTRVDEIIVRLKRGETN